MPGRRFGLALAFPPRIDFLGPGLNLAGHRRPWEAAAMPETSRENGAVAVVGLGYVGLPLAVALAKRYPVTGFDEDAGRVAELKRGFDRTGEVVPSDLRASTLSVTAEAEDIRAKDVYILTVPTPVDGASRPDLSAVRGACRTVGRLMTKGALVVLESTVYPGVTEEVCGPELARASGLVAGRDFHLGYSPERINPGDREHTVDKIVKVVAGETPEVARRLKDLYGAVTAGGVFVARDIKTAEAAKVIENAQRDINIAFVNEVAMICGRLGISVHDVLQASLTKWNFLDFKPGLVGGHCIGVDPFYLAHLAEAVGHHPEIILAGRRINDGMGPYVAARVDEQLKAVRPAGAARVLVLGLTFKENVADLRNSKAVDVVRGLEARGHRVDVHDPVADAAESERLYGLKLLPQLHEAKGYDGVVGVVAHAGYLAFSARMLASLVRPGGLVADLKGMWRHVALPDGVRYWQL
jgi:UDP-N-acetyl-D-galactosamine dehydrogenase